MRVRSVPELLGNSKRVSQFNPPPGCTPATTTCLPTRASQAVICFRQVHVCKGQVLNSWYRQHSRDRDITVVTWEDLFICDKIFLSQILGSNDTQAKHRSIKRSTVRRLQNCKNDDKRKGGQSFMNFCAVLEYQKIFDKYLFDAEFTSRKFRTASEVRRFNN